MSKILVWLSGGVDSAVVAYLLREAGHDVSCGFMINYISDTPDCPTLVDIEEARKVAAYLDLPFHTFDYRTEYEKRIVEYIYEGYQKWLTPNPDILCNNLVKFDCFLGEALEYGFDKIATGHYARIEEEWKNYPPDKGEWKGVMRTAPLIRGVAAGRGVSGISEEENTDSQGKFDFIPYNPKLTELAQKNRKNPTVMERKFWYEIIKTPFFASHKFTRQKPLLDYIVDFYCSELNLVIEIDGDSHAEQIGHDDKRTKELEEYGITVLRYTNRDIMNNIEGIYEKLVCFVENPPASHPPLSGGQESIFHLLKWVDPNKDQTYFLSRLNQFQLSHALFPIGHLSKPEVREIARRASLPNAERKDSQWLCFIGKVSMKEFLEKRLPKKPGDILDTAGNILGQHEGAFSYTIGQRKGIQIGGGPALFVVGKDIANNTITVGTESELELYSSELTAIDWHWIGEPREFPFSARAKIRYRQDDQDIECTEVGEGRVRVHFKSSQRAITSGQTVAIYDWDELIASGIIE